MIIIPYSLRFPNGYKYQGIPRFPNGYKYQGIPRLPIDPKSQL